MFQELELWDFPVQTQLQDMGEIKVTEQAQGRNKTSGSKYTFIGYGAVTLISVLAALVAGVAGYLVLSAVELPVGIPFDWSLICAIPAFAMAVSLATVGCFIIWLIAERPLSNPEGYIALPEHCCMLLLLWPVWAPIWIYHTTKALNSKPCKKDKPVAQLLLCLFVPYYWIYWFYRQGKRVDQLSAEKKYFKTSALCLILAFFIPVAAGYMLQKRINEPCEDPEGYFDLPLHFWMLLLCPVVWLPVWIYHTTKALNSKSCKKDNSVAQLLLCMFVPYYNVYWFYRQGKRVDQLPTEKKQGKTAVLCLILALLVPVAAYYMLQKRINERVM